jgi:uncharacterized protein DUF4258
VANSKVSRERKLAHIRACLREKRYWTSKHAVTEALKDGISPDERLHVINSGEIIEEYENGRCLVFGITPSNMPFHVVVEISEDETGNVVIVSNYIPDARYWEKDWKRRKPMKAKYNA